MYQWDLHSIISHFLSLVKVAGAHKLFQDIFLIASPPATFVKKGEYTVIQIIKVSSTNTMKAAYLCMVSNSYLDSNFS